MPEHYRRRRIGRLLVIGAAVEIGLLVFARVAPAMASLARTAMFIVAGLFALAILIAALRDRSGTDRRNGERRERESTT